jgi:hypothetical protein
LDASFKIAYKCPVEPCSLFQFSLRYVEFLLSNGPDHLAERFFYPRARLNLLAALSHADKYREVLSVIDQGPITDNSNQQVGLTEEIGRK